MCFFMLTHTSQLYDACPVCDGAAAVVLSSNPALALSARPVVRIAGSASATDLLAVSLRADPLHLTAAAESTRKVAHQRYFGGQIITSYFTGVSAGRADTRGH